MQPDEIPPGTLYLLILKTLARSGEMHGYQIANSIQRILRRRSAGRRGLVVPGVAAHAHQGLGDRKVGRHRRKPPRALLPVNPAGRKQVAVETSQFQRVVAAITRVIEAV